MKIRAFLCTYTCLSSSTVMSDIQHISFCFFLPSYFSPLLPAGLWIFLQIGNMRVKKKKKDLLPFLSAWCVFRHCASLLTPLTPLRWLQEVTPVITAENRLTPHCPVMPPSLTSFSATFHSSWTVESEFNKAQITTRFLLLSCSPLCCCCTPPLLCTSTSMVLCVIIHMIFE